MYNHTQLQVFGRLSRIMLSILLGGSLALAAFAAQAFGSAVAHPPLKVVATFSILGDMVKEIGGEHVTLTTIVGPGSDSHTFEPTPQDIKALAGAQVLVLNGLDFEAWLPRLMKAANFKGEAVLASDGVAVRYLDAGEGAHGDDHHDHHDHQTGDVDAHAWQSLENGMIYANNIAEGLAAAAPAYRAYYKSRAKAYIEQMKKLDAEIKLALADVPAAKRKVVAAHDAFGYFANAYNIQFFSVAGLSSQAEPSAKEMAALVDSVKRTGVSGIFMEHATSAKLVEQIARETGAQVGGVLYSDALAKPDSPASTYLGMFTWNAGQLIYVLKGDMTKK